MMRKAPRLSAAIMIPSLYVKASTLVPVTMGCLFQAVSKQWIDSAVRHILRSLHAMVKRILRFVLRTNVEGISSVGVKRVISLQTVRDVSIASTKISILCSTYWTAPVCRKVIHNAKLGIEWVDVGVRGQVLETRTRLTVTRLLTVMCLGNL